MWVHVINMSYSFLVFFWIYSLWKLGLLNSPEISFRQDNFEFSL
jgi:hypothetical protein